MHLDELENLMSTQRAVRKFRDEPVDDALLSRILRAATRAPSARNVQPWHFIVIRDPETKGKLGHIFDELGQQFYGHGAPERQHWSEVPVLIAVCSNLPFGQGPGSEAATGASVYPAVQNLLLAAHAAGLGTVLTTRWKSREAEVRPLLGLPDEMAVHAIIPMGWPAEKLGKNRRKPVGDVTSRERYGRQW